jgi:hypothetical protein
MISSEDLDLFMYVDTAEEACRFVFDYYKIGNGDEFEPPTA